MKQIIGISLMLIGVIPGIVWLCFAGYMFYRSLLIWFEDRIAQTISAERDKLAAAQKDREAYEASSLEWLRDMTAQRDLAEKRLRECLKLLESVRGFAEFTKAHELVSQPWAIAILKEGKG